MMCQKWFLFGLSLVSILLPKMTNCFVDKAMVLKHHPDKRKAAGEPIKEGDNDYFTCITKGKRRAGNLKELLRISKTACCGWINCPMHFTSDYFQSSPQSPRVAPPPTASGDSRQLAVRDAHQAPRSPAHQSQHLTGFRGAFPAQGPTFSLFRCCCYVFCQL